ncbi:MAG TPA: HNH endonuclease signature motif containing protein [Galbitalea sp.]|jgi:hypothetical protein
MTFAPPSPLDRFRAAARALANLPTEVPEYRALAESELLAINDECAAMERVLAARRALIAGEAAHRSRPALGSDGLARRSGHRTVESFLKHTAGLSGQQALTAVRAGVLLGDLADDGRVDEATGEVFAPRHPWLAPVAASIADGAISIVAAEVIGAGLGVPNSAVSVDDLRGAAALLVAESISGVDPDRLRVRAREMRDELDVAGVPIREDERRAARRLVHFERPSGGGRAIWDMDPETYASFRDFYDRAVSPKIRGARFLGTAQTEIARRIEKDGRTIGQLASDTLLQILCQGMDADTSFMLGTGAPVVRITVAEKSLESGIGVGLVDGLPDPVSISSTHRLLCSADTLRVGFAADGSVNEIGREHRLFSQRQREALAVKFGGCAHPGCGRPPSWCEAHHIEHWERDRGRTVIGNGILLCKHHHLKYHNEGWEITRDHGGKYWLIPPASIDPQQQHVEMVGKSRALRELARATAR